MKRIIFTTLVAISIIFCITTYAKTQEQPLDQLIATVNDDVITKSELNRAMMMAKAQFEQAQGNPPQDKELKKQVLDQLINKKLELQAAKQANIKTTDQELNQAIAQIAKQNNISVNEVYQRVNQEGMTKLEYRRELRDQLTMQKLQQEEIIKRIVITPQEVATFLKNNKTIQDTSRASQYHLQDILIPVTDNATPQQISAAQDEANTIVQQFKKGQSFNDFVKAAPNNVKIDDLGMRSTSEIPSLFVEPASRLNSNEVTAPIKAGNGFHVLFLVEKNTTNTPITITKKEAESLVLQKKFEESMKVWMSKLRSQAFIVTNNAE
ncbi:MAG: hypothetical protein A3F12_06040 [Gammaproteobacteria bacterium RIFCSPHIGHO2_12_FULL_38_14]|nr:MAG: hypothetical protein A3F12_06040 [Gammaproteobacteria bacterium RIFCSPHIGHO2_12_FULL_38_14]